MLTVSVPTFRTPARLLARAVDGLLAQTVPVRVVVVNDGGPRVDLPPRAGLTVLDLPENRGRYHADAVVLAALDDGDWWAPHDADDWADPDLYEGLLAVEEAGCGLGAYWRHELRGQPKVQLCADPSPSAGFRHVTHWCAGVYQAGRVRAGGGVHPGWRIGWDTMHTMLVTLTGPVGVTRDARWHWQRREGSLTRAADTRMGSPAREQAKSALRRLWRDCWAAYQQGTSPGDVVRATVTVEQQQAVERDAARLRTLLGGYTPAVPRARVDTSSVAVTVLTGGRAGLLARTVRSVDRAAPGLLDDAVVVRNGNDDDTGRVLGDRFKVDQPGGWLAVGEATSRCADHAARSGRRFWLHLEDDWEAGLDPGWLDRAMRILDSRPDVGQVRLRRADERVLRRHMVTGAPIRWTRHDGYALADAHLTFNPSLVRTADVRDGWPSGSEGDAQRRWLAAGWRQAAQLTPGVFRHLGDQQSLQPRGEVEGNPWALPDAALDALRVRLADVRPRLAVEAGSGRSTYVLADMCERVVTLEHERRFSARLAGLPDHVDVRTVPLGPYATPAGPGRWYRTRLPDGVDFALIDGPPGSIGRHCALYALAPHLTADAEVWLDDAERDGERDALAGWAAHLGVRWSPHPDLPRIAVIRR